jgi:hypothetical protein
VNDGGGLMGSGIVLEGRAGGAARGIGTGSGAGLGSSNLSLGGLGGRKRPFGDFWRGDFERCRESVEPSSE